jgi:hypothetical protein
LSARRDGGDCGDQGEDKLQGELELHLGSLNGSSQGGHERKDTAESGHLGVGIGVIPRFSFQSAKIIND